MSYEEFVKYLNEKVQDEEIVLSLPEVSTHTEEDEVETHIDETLLAFEDRQRY